MQCCAKAKAKVKAAKQHLAVTMAIFEDAHAPHDYRDGQGVCSFKVKGAVARFQIFWDALQVVMSKRHAVQREPPFTYIMTHHARSLM